MLGHRGVALLGGMALPVGEGVSLGEVTEAQAWLVCHCHFLLPEDPDIELSATSNIMSAYRLSCCCAAC